MQSKVQIMSNTSYPIGKIINQELEHSDNTQIAVAFLKSSGIKVIEDSLMMSLENGGEFELIVGLDFKTTDPKAMKYFIDLHKQNKKVHFYCYGDKGENKNNIVFHPKIYLFHNQKETVSIVGSTNLTAGGLLSNFEVNTIFSEKKPEYYTQLQAIYNSVKYTDTLFTPDEEYLCQYSDVFKAFEKNEQSAKKDKGIKETIKQIAKKEQTLPGTIPSVNSMIIEFLKQKKAEGVLIVSLSEIYDYLEKRIQDPIFKGRYKLDTFHNTIRGELNKHELNSNFSNSMHLYERVEKGKYALTKKGNLYEGR